jgi:hypothetical protein
MTKPVHVTRAQARRLERNLEGQGRVKHLCRRQESELGATRYHAFCGYSSTTSREFHRDVMRNGRQVVTCDLCLAATNLQRRSNLLVVENS